MSEFIRGIHGSIDIESVQWVASEFDRLNLDQISDLMGQMETAQKIASWERGSVRVDPNETVIYLLGGRAAVIPDLDYDGKLSLASPRTTSDSGVIRKSAEKLELDTQEWSMDDVLSKDGVSVTLKDRDGDIPVVLDIGHRLMLAALLDDVTKAKFSYGTWIKMSITIEPRLFVHGVITTSKRDGVQFYPAV